MSYYDADGNECTLPVMCMREPGWAANRIQHTQAELSALRALVAELEAKLATLEAPPVVPEGWRVESLGRGCVSFRHGTDNASCLLVPPQILRAMAWAAENNARPPHALDGKEGGE